MSSDLIEIKNLNKDFTDKTGYKVQILEDLSLSIEKGKVTSILAPKGSGKSTLLKIIAGLETGLTDESIYKNNSIVFLPSRASSFPWLDVRSNITYNFKQASGEEVKKIISLVGLEGYENHHPDNRSLGFRFRIALGRTLIRKPDLILIDESFNAMSSEIKDDMYKLLLSAKHELSLSLIVGTSNISEAVLLSDVIYLMDKNPGRIIDRIESELDPDRTTGIIEKDIFLDMRSIVEKRIAQFSKHKFMDYSF